MYPHSGGGGAFFLRCYFIINCFSSIGSGVPNEMHRCCNGTTSISSHTVPATSDAVDMFIAQGGSLTLHGLFGCDPLRDRQDLVQRRDQYFLSTHHSFVDIFSDIVSGDGDLFRNAILDLIRISVSLQCYEYLQLKMLPCFSLREEVCFSHLNSAHLVGGWEVNVLQLPKGHRLGSRSVQQFIWSVKR